MTTHFKVTTVSLADEDGHADASKAITIKKWVNYVLIDLKTSTAAYSPKSDPLFSRYTVTCYDIEVLNPKTGYWAAYFETQQKPKTGPSIYYRLEAKGNRALNYELRLLRYYI